MASFEKNWEKALELLRGDISEASYEAWIEPLHPKSLDHSKKILYVECDNRYIIQVFNKRYLQLFENAISVAYGEDLHVEATVFERAMEPEKMGPSNSIADYPLDDELSQENYLNPRYNFESFVVGKTNEFAYTAARAVAEAPATKYNPLFLYGGSGLGKTHLMHAIGHYILKNNKNKKVLYVTSEMFTNELISSLGNTDTRLKAHKRQTQFRNKYRKVDVLLIDDIQFLEGKEATQTEFFNTFEALYSRNKQIIISSDRPPQELKSLDERLTSRFLWSMAADIQAPDYEMRIAILLKKAEEENIEITPDVRAVIGLIAEKIPYNVREMEGALNRITGFSTLMQKPITMAFARTTLKDILANSDSIISTESIKRNVCKYYNVTLKDMDSPKRARSIAYPRQIAMYLAKELTDQSLPKIGETFGGRDHTTVLYACNKIREDMKENSTLKEEIEEIKNMIR